MSVRKTSKFSVLDIGSAPAVSTVKSAVATAAISGLSGEQELLAALTAGNIPYTIHDHVAAFTVEEQAAVVGHLPGTLTKNLFLKDKKYGFYLITAAAGTFLRVSFHCI